MDSTGRSLRGRIALAAGCLALVVPGFAVAQRGGDDERRGPAAKPAPPADLESAREAEERRRARRATPESRAERRRSRTEHREQGRAEALALAREEHRELVEAPVWEPLDLAVGTEVERFFGEYGAQVRDADGRRGAVDSTLPLRSELGEGPKRLADLALADRGAALVPENPLVATRIPKRPMDGVEVGRDGFAVGLESPSESEATVVEGRAFAANALTDTDMVVVPTPRGVQVAFQVRSADAPDEATLPVRLPEGAELRLVVERRSPGPGDPPVAARGSAEVVRGDEVLVSIAPPVAWDADGEPLNDVRYEVEGSDLVVHFPHRSADVLYPLVVDPQIDRFRINENGSPIGNGSYVIGHSNDLERAAWNFNFGGAGSHNYGQFPQQASFTYEHNNILAIANVTGQYFENNAFGQWYWQAPRQSWIYRADFVNLHFNPTYGAEAQCVLEGVYSVTRSNWEANATYGSPPAGGPSYPGPWVGGPAPDGSCSPQSFDSKSHFNHVSPTPGNISVFRLFAFGSGVRPNEARAHLDGAAVHLEDGQHPSVTSASSSPGGWVRSATISTTVGTRDAAPGVPVGQGGLGMFLTALEVPKEGGGTGAPPVGYANCHLRLSRCPESQTFSFSYSTEGDVDAVTPGNQRMPEGTNTIRGETFDANAKGTRFTAGTVRIDRSVPTAAVGGFAEGELLRDRDYTINGTGSDPVSGVQSVIVRLDGVEKARRSPTSNPCPAGANVTCSAPFTLDGGDQALSEGLHTVQTVVTDLAGNPRTTSRSFRVERTAPTVDVETSSLMPEGGVWVAKGEQDVLFDAYDEGTGVVRAELRIDGNLIDSVDQDCAAGGCELSHDFYSTTDGLAEGEHTVTASAIDAAGNPGRRQQTIRLERGAPSLSLSGSLKAAEGQTLAAGQTYDLTASGSDGSGPAMQSGLGALKLMIDGDEVKLFEQPCEMGGCGMSRTFQYVVDEYPDGPQEVAVTATDFAGNETVETFTVNNPQPPEPSCQPSPDAQPAGLPSILSPDLVEQAFRTSLPEAFEQSSLVELAEFQIEPALDASAGEEFRAADTVVESTFDRDATDGVTTMVHTDTQPNCTTPTAVSPSPSDPVLVERDDQSNTGVAALYANSGPATDTVLRATGTGALTLTQMRDATAPADTSWNVALQPGQQLSELPGGSVAVIEPAEEGTEAPGMLEGLPPAPTLGERREAVSDTDVQLRQASDALERAQGGNPDRVVGLMPPPWAEDSLGNAVATSLAVAGSTVTMRVARTPTTTFPVVAGNEYVSRDGVDEYETLSAGADVPDEAWDDQDVYEADTEGATVIGPPNQPDPQDDELDEPVGGESGELTDDVGDIDDGDQDVGVMASARPKRVDAGRLAALEVGITTADPSTIDDANYRGPAPDPLNPQHVRPFARWNHVRASDNPEKRKITNQWNGFVSRARNKLMAGQNFAADVAIARDTVLGRGATTNFTARTYRERLVAFTKDFGWDTVRERRGENPDGSPRIVIKVLERGILGDLMAWNEPQYGGNPDSEKPNRGDPLKERPLFAARLWVQAMHACHAPNAEGPRCGELSPDGSTFTEGRVVAGQFAGKPRDVVSTHKGRKRNYVAHYREELRRESARLGPQRPLRRMPRVVSFHNYGDMRRFTLFTGRKREEAPILERFRRSYKSGAWNYSEGDQQHQPAIWITEVGAPYHLKCGSIGRPLIRDRFCEDEAPADKVTLLGMRRQAQTGAFLLRALANRFGPELRRVYYYGLQTRRNCGKERGRPNAQLICPLAEYSLLGARDDDRYVELAGQGNGPFVKPHGSNDYSASRERRFVFCLMRNRRERHVRKPARIRREADNPADRCPATKTSPPG